MSTTLSLPNRSHTSHRAQILASASALVAAAAVAVALAVAGGDGGTTASQPSAHAGPASPNLATQYRNETAVSSVPARRAGVTAADRFHHFH